MMLLSKEDMDVYFSCHLQKDTYLSAGAEQLSGALAVAENDVACQLDIFPPQDTALFTAAVAEQLLALLADPSCGTVPLRLASESVDGLGSRSYFCGNPPEERLLAPRALMYIRKLNRKNQTTLLRG